MAPKYKYELEDKVWVIATEEAGIIKDIRGNKYEVLIERHTMIEDHGDEEPAYWIWFDESGYVTCMAHELLPYTEGMELLYE